MYDVKVTGLKEFEAGLARIEAGVTDPIPLLKEIAQIQAHGTEAQFAQGGQPTWPDIKPKSRRQRKGNKSAPPLTDTGALGMAATATAPGVKNSLFALTPDILTMGVDRADAARHQDGFFGTDSRGRNVNEPARTFLKVTPQAEAEFAEVGELYMDGLKKGL